VISIDRIYEAQVFGEFGGVNPSITDSATYTFLSPQTMSDTFEGSAPGCYLYSRHWNPANRNLARACALLEGAEAAHVTASGMAAIAATLLQLCRSGDEIVASRTIYGGTYALLANFLPDLGIKTRFVNMDRMDEVRAAITARTRVIYGECLSNPLLQVADLPRIAEIAKAHDAVLVMDNTFSPLLLRPIEHGADVVIHSLTKFINGHSDCVAGVICGRQEFIDRLSDVNRGAAMLLGPVLDSMRSAGIWKNLHTLHLRMAQHSRNALHLARHLEKSHLKVHYPGLPGHPHHERFRRLSDMRYGFGGMLVIDVGNAESANALMTRMQNEKLGLLAVSLGYFRTLFSAPGHSTSSEIPAQDQDAMGLGQGMIRMSVGLDADMEALLERMDRCIQATKLVRV